MPSFLFLSCKQSGAESFGKKRIFISRERNKFQIRKCKKYEHIYTTARKKRRKKRGTHIHTTSEHRGVPVFPIYVVSEYPTSKWIKKKKSSCSLSSFPFLLLLRVVWMVFKQKQLFFIYLLFFSLFLLLSNERELHSLLCVCLRWLFFDHC